MNNFQSRRSYRGKNALLQETPDKYWNSFKKTASHLREKI